MKFELVWPGKLEKIFKDIAKEQGIDKKKLIGRFVEIFFHYIFFLTRLKYF
jgi:hypothetical protein